MRRLNNFYTMFSPPVASVLRNLWIPGIVLCVLTACGRERAHEAGLEWKNAPLEITSRVETPSAERLRQEGFEDLGAAPRRLFKARVQDPEPGGLDSVSLLDFGDETAAYAAFQELSSHEEDFAEGFVAREEAVYFRRGAWIGRIAPESWRGAFELGDNLSVPGTPAGDLYEIPDAFASLMRQGRVEASERILTREFMGLPTDARVYAARYACRGDTAWIFASAGLFPDFGLRAAKAFGGRIDSSSGDLEVHGKSMGSTPLHLRFSGQGMVGVEGCFDDSLTNFWIKMQARALKNLK